MSVLIDIEHKKTPHIATFLTLND